MTITTILCDLDGTLVDSRQDIAVAFQHAWRAVVGGSPPSAAAIAQHIGKPLAWMLSELGGVVSPSQVNTFLAAYRHAYARQDACLTRPYPGVIAGLQALSGFMLGIVTTKEQGQAELVLRRLALMRFFQHVQGGTPGLRLKPAPDTIFAALAALHCAPPQALMVGDTPADILAGKAAGTATCAVTYGFGGREALLQCAPDYVIDAFGELVILARGCSG
ncbi:MAG TPA: HAD-IA family hydrolase [Candidatus Tectomicrobia bacterium]|nr:HAD-IA family hydrolase [Candidatus Tectomicrobia bacterium]